MVVQKGGPLTKTAHNGNLTQAVIKMMADDKKMSPTLSVAEVKKKFGLSRREAEKAVELAVHKIEMSEVITDADLEVAVRLLHTTKESAMLDLISRGKTYVVADLLMRMAGAAQEAACRP